MDVIEEQPIFANTGQAVHVAFIVMSQPAIQPAPLRNALIRAMESIRLEKHQHEWLQQLRGKSSEAINFGGLTGDEVRAQCAMITQAVKQLPAPEMWVLQAKYGSIEFEDVAPGALTEQQMVDALTRATAEVEEHRERVRVARLALEAAREQHLACEGRVTRATVEQTVKDRYYAARDDLRDACVALARVESTARTVEIAVRRVRGGALANDGIPVSGEGNRRFAFSAERIDAIKGLSDWLRPLLPRVKPLAIDCLLGRHFSKHAKVGITLDDIAKNFGGCSKTYQRASSKMQAHLRQLEALALQHLEERLVRDGVAMPTESV